MAWAYLSSPGIHFDYIDQRYSAREIGRIPDAVIEHDSAHDEARRASRGRFKTLLREFERRLLRTGRTRQSRLKGEMSVLVVPRRFFQCARCPPSSKKSPDWRRQSGPTERTVRTGMDARTAGTVYPICNLRLQP